MSSKRAAFYSTEGVLALECKNFKSDSAITILSKLKSFFPVILNGKVVVSNVLFLLDVSVFLLCRGLCMLTMNKP